MNLQEVHTTLSQIRDEVFGELAADAEIHRDELIAFLHTEGYNQDLMNEVQATTILFLQIDQAYDHLNQSIDHLENVIHLTN